MAKPLLDDAVWQWLEPLLPAPKPRRSRFPGRKPLSNRQALTGILFVLKMEIPWEELPQELGCGSGMSCWRRLREWQEAGIWDLLVQTLRYHLPYGEKIEWSRVDEERRRKHAVADDKAEDAMAS